MNDRLQDVQDPAVVVPSSEGSTVPVVVCRDTMYTWMVEDQTGGVTLDVPAETAARWKRAYLDFIAVASEIAEAVEDQFEPTSDSPEVDLAGAYAAEWDDDASPADVDGADGH